ncbi:prostaglandin F2-alpha receptor [Conger conger]|uniref:prostaglandin F2-alpha receptor n=1 Tax=Conger conger TaxID=82655 RepID=UPI002A5ACFD8|nr:prostaglandin F2-alpha receptor [Conger conger]
MSRNGTARDGCSSSNSTSDQTPLSVKDSVISMSVGMLSNMLALLILARAYRRFRLKTRASFLLFASGLVTTNFLGHFINGSLAVYVYSVDMDWGALVHRRLLCDFFGASMVFFGLSPLLLGSAMAAERCFGVTRPLFHSAALTSRHTKKLVGLVWLLAAFVALLPVLTHRSYHVQSSQSWCFFRQEGTQHWLDVLLPLLFSGLGLLSLSVSILCNAVTGLTLLRSKLHSTGSCKRTTQHLEMICQVLAIMLVSCVCWAPFLVTVTIQTTQLQGRPCYGQMLLVVRMAACNQILDPWVYILLRRAVVKKLFLVTRGCCGLKSLYKWNCSTLKGSMRARNFPPSGTYCGRLETGSLPMTPIKPVPCT